MIKAIPFTDRANEKEIREDIQNDPESFAINKLKNEGRFGFGVQNIMQYGVYKELGYRYDLRTFLKRFVYKQYGQWYESYALNKTNLRALVSGRIDEIAELK